MSIENLITDNIDIWTSAIENKKAAGRGSNKKYELYGIKKLRELILELAVRGKLVPQDPTDEPASVLLERIAQEKAQLVKDKKIKKPKKLPEISDEEKPFELPDGWTWSRLGNFVNVDMGQSPPSKFYNQNKNGLPFFQGKADFGKKHPTARYWCLQPKKYAYSGDILLSVRAPVGPTNIANIECCIGRGLAALRPLKETPTSYIFHMMQGFRKILESFATGTTFVAVSKVHVDNLVVSVPPLDEQKRIVKKIEALMSLCDQLEQQTESNIEAHKTLVEVMLTTLTNSKNAEELNQNWTRISECFDTLFTTEESIDQLKQTILQLAVMGKLVPQDPNDEPASKLLERIAEEKALLIKDKKIKKQKALPPITDEEKPFELPNGWEWCRLPDLGELARGKSKHRPRNDPKLYEFGTIPLVQTGDVARANGIIDTYTALYNEQGLAQSHLWPKGTLCITIAANIADTAILGFDACFPDSVVGYTPFNKNIPTKYFDYFIKTAKSNLEKFAPSTAQKNINLEILSQVLVPCPPIKECIEIVEYINGFFGLCEQLKLCLRESQQTQVHLTDSIIEITV